jgi:hypothetical protein
MLDGLVSCPRVVRRLARCSQVINAYFVSVEPHMAQTHRAMKKNNMVRCSIPLLKKSDDEYLITKNSIQYVERNDSDERQLSLVLEILIK